MVDPAQREQAERVLASELGIPVHPERDPVALAARIPAQNGGGEAAARVAHALTEPSAVSLSWAWTALGLVLRTPNAVMSAGFVLLFPITF